MSVPISRPLFRPSIHPDTDLLFYTYANAQYHEFAILYPLFALLSNKNSAVEICLSEPDSSVTKYEHLIKYYVEFFSGRILYSYITKTDILQNSLRFIVKPVSRAKYIYIGDVDILILEEEVLNIHRAAIRSTKLNFSNVRRKGENKITGLHFMEYDKYYPIVIPCNVDLITCNDESLLFLLMLEKGYSIPEVSDLKYRPVHGLHISLFSRPPLPTLTTQDRISDTPSWFGQSEDTSIFVEKYLSIRHTQPVIQFMSSIRDEDIVLRRTIQFIDMFCYYTHREYGDSPCKM